jgi:hypothetical protein
MMLEQLKHLLVALLLLLLVATVCETLDPGKEKEQMRHGKSKFGAHPFSSVRSRQ